MRYIDLTLPEDNEPTYNRFQIVSGIILSVAAAGIIIFAAVSLVNDVFIR